MAKSLKITQVKSVIGSPQIQRDTMSPLGLKRVRQFVVHPDDPAVRGQVHKAHHLITVEETN